MAIRVSEQEQFATHVSILMCLTLYWKAAEKVMKREQRSSLISRLVFTNIWTARMQFDMPSSVSDNSEVEDKDDGLSDAELFRKGPMEVDTEIEFIYETASGASRY
jgi:hypothetical protein